MSALVVLEWSLAMFESVEKEFSYLPDPLECVCQFHPALNSDSRRNSTGSVSPTRLDIALAAIKMFAHVSSNSPLDGTSFTVHGSEGFFIFATNVTELRERIISAFSTNPPSKFSFPNLLQNLNTYLGPQKNPVDVIIFCSSSRNLRSSHEFRNLAPSERSKILPLPNESSLNIVAIGASSFSPIDLDFFKEIIGYNFSSGSIYELTEENSLDLVISKVKSDLFQPFIMTMKFGQLSGRVRLNPNLRGHRDQFASSEMRLLGVMDKSAIDKLLPTNSFLLSSAVSEQKTSADALLDPHLAPLIHATIRMMAEKVVLVSIGETW